MADWSRSEAEDSLLEEVEGAVVGFSVQHLLDGTSGRGGLPSEVVLEPGDDPVPRLSAVNLDLIVGAPQAHLVERLGRLSDERMRQICAALEVAVACT